MNITGKFFAVLLAALLLVSAFPAAAAAASLEITASIKTSLDQTIANADRTQAAKIKSLYDELLTLQKQTREWDEKTSALHTANGEALAALQKQIKQIDAAKLEKLEAEAVQARERYKPLLDQYSSLNKQLEAARLISNKDLVGIVRFQINVLKIPVQVARANIKTKEEAWRTAKETASKTAKKIRATLSDADPVNVQLKAKKKAINTIETNVTPVWTAFKKTAKKGDAGSVLGTLTSVVSLSRQICEEQQKVYKLETKISDILSTAKAQIP